MHRVQKLLSNYGYCSRREAEKLIEEGRVKVNGRVAAIGWTATEDDRIEVDGKALERPKQLYLVFNKPVGCVTALTDRHEKTIMAYISIPERVVPVGRLDKWTSGLLLLTNDGDWANKIMHPSFELKKRYIAELDEAPRDRELKRVSRGIELDDGPTRPAMVKRLTQKRIELEIHEGKNRIVRRMFEKLGYRVKKLHRAQVGSLRLGRLKPGEWRHLSKEEAESILK